MYLPYRRSFHRWFSSLSLVLLTGCIAAPDFSAKSDRAALEEAYRAQSVAAQRTRAIREDAAIESLLHSGLHSIIDQMAIANFNVISDVVVMT